MNICVFGAASVTSDKKYTDAVEEMGEHLAKRGYNLVYGSGSTGNMGAAARGFKKGGGKTHGVIPNFFKEDLNEFVDFNCDKMTFTESMRERKAVMEREADAFIITPGGIGTFEEFFEVLTLKQLGRHRKPIVIYNINGYYDNMIAAMEHSIGEGFIRPTCNTLYKVFNDLDGMIEYIENDDMNGMTLHDFK
ncbi:MAG: TIGR00730 family Rossman fold protein [Eubacterium sp.]|nr:TIGR00730 family Rossman fold protein [Eubacterium sp.]